MADAPAAWPTEQCRTCRAPIIWTTTDRGKDMPVDAEPTASANLLVYREGNGPVRSRVVAAHLAFGRTDLRLSHFVKCPQADRWRRSR